MDRSSLRIIFLGNPEFAAYQLSIMLDAGFNIVAVVSAPDKPAGRGLNLRPTAVTQLARKKDIPLLQPANLKDPLFLEQLGNFKANIQVVIAFRMLPEKVWNMPPKGTLNLHASLLPQYRGAAPINRVIINGESETGVTTFRLQHEIDTGNILLQKKCAIDPLDDAGTLHDKLMLLGAEAMVETLDKVISGEDDGIAQEYSGILKTAPKIHRKDCEINWNADSSSILNIIRGLSPYPTAFTTFEGKQMKIYTAAVSNQNIEKRSKAFISDKKSYLLHACQDGFIEILELQLEGKKRMKTGEFLRGYQWQE